MISKEIETYCELHSSPTSELLQKIARQSYLRTNQGHMISGPLQSSFIAQLVQLSGAKRVLEIGTFTAYTSIAIAEALPENGKVFTIEINPEHHHIAQEFISSYEKKASIELILGDAKEVVPTLNESWDLVLIDAAKKDNAFYYDALVAEMKPGGLFLLDNVLWKGKVVDKEQDKRTQLIDAFNKKLAADTRVDVTLLPIRDGITLIRKK